MSDAVPVQGSTGMDARHTPRDGSPMGQRDFEETVQETTEVQEEEITCLRCGAKATDGWYLCLECLESEEREMEHHDQP